jgi:hypothetical protein
MRIYAKGTIDISWRSIIVVAKLTSTAVSGEEVGKARGWTIVYGKELPAFTVAFIIALTVTMAFIMDFTMMLPLVTTVVITVISSSISIPTISGMVTAILGRKIVLIPNIIDEIH